MKELLTSPGWMSSSSGPLYHRLAVTSRTDLELLMAVGELRSAVAPFALGEERYAW